jgi:hypothetical protein
MLKIQRSGLAGIGDGIEMDDTHGIFNEGETLKICTRKTE